MRPARLTLPACLLGAVALALTSLIAQAPPDQKTVAAHRLHYPARLSPADSEQLLRAIAADLNAGDAPDVYGVLRDVGGNHCGLIECDIICRADGQHWDVLADSTDTTATSEGDHNHNGISDDLEDGIDDGMYFGTGTPTWQDKGTTDPARCLIVPGATAPPPPPPPPPPPECPACPSCPPDQQAEVARLQQQLQQLRTDYTRVDTLYQALLARPEPTCEIANRFWRALGVGCRVVYPEVK